MKTHVTNTVRGCFSALRQIRSVRRSLTRHVLVTLVRALVVSKVDYCNAVLVGIPGYLEKRLQSVLNAAALLIYSAKKYDHITPYSGNCIGCVSRNVSSSGYVCWPTAVWLAQRHSTWHSKPVYQSCCSLSSAFCWQSNVATAVNSAYHTRRPSVLCCSGARLEQSAARDSKFGLIVDIPTND